MLAPNFKTPAELDLSDDSFSTLVGLLGDFERGEIDPDLFDMRTVGNPACGTPSCILGWARTRNIAFHYPQRFTIFFPGSIAVGPDGVYRSPYTATPAHAAIALRNFLTYGEPRWHEAMMG